MAKAAPTATSITRLAAPVPMPVLAVVLSFLCPSELSLYLAGLRLPPHRVALLILLPMAVKRLITGKDVRIRSFDILILLYSVWSMSAYAIAGEGTSGLVYGGSVALEAFGSYIVSRAFVRDAHQFMATLKFLIVVVLVAGLIAMPETIGGGYYTHDFLRSLLGGEPPPPVEMRLGLYRAASVFDHPIHLGTFCSSLLALIWCAERKLPVRFACLAICIVATLTALSSAPMLCLGLQMGLIALERVSRGIPARLTLFLVAVGGIYIGAALVGNRSPIAIIATGFTIDSWTGFYRLMIWQYGVDTVINYPLLGIGQADWDRPDWMVAATIDAFWLVIAMRTGIPALLMLLAAMIALVRAVLKSRRRTSDPAMKRIAVGWMISLTALSLAAATVHLWNVIFAYFFFFIGLGGWIADPLKESKAKASRLAPSPLSGVPFSAAPATARIGR